MFNFLFRNENLKKIKRYLEMVKTIRDIERDDLKDYTFEKIQSDIKKYKEHISFLDTKEEKLDFLNNIKLEVFALVSKCANLMADQPWFKMHDGNIRKWELRPYDVQLLGWLVLNDWKISEMKTWEGKTLVATFPAVLNALLGESVHIVTVNDYLAKRDALEMGLMYYMLWLTTWVIIQNQTTEQRKIEYSKDIVYWTNNQLGFDYLKDNMINNLNQKVMWKLSYAIIDEVDSILIDEARTPLVISQPLLDNVDKYIEYNKIILELHEEKWDKKWDFKIFEKDKIVILTWDGINKLEKILNKTSLYQNGWQDIYFIEKALQANHIYKKDIDYIVTNWQVMIVDEHTWRVLEGRRFSNWLHQALEAKEWVEIKNESKTLANITYQNFFRLYDKLSWMTWTAITEEEEFNVIYWLDVVEIPTNKPIIRNDHSNLLFKNEEWKMSYLLSIIKDFHKKWRPVLVWTGSVEQSEKISNMLMKDKSSGGLKHYVLNAKLHNEEALVIWQAWKKWAITIATNMAWRWTDIKITDEVRELGGLVIIWTEKHETRRIDNQLRWRSWRQWDPWDTYFLLSPEDKIMRMFGWEKLYNLFNGWFFASYPNDEPLVNTNILTKRINGIQKEVEWSNFDIRKHILQYDDVFNIQRKIFYKKRLEILSIDRKEEIEKYLEENYIKYLNNKIKFTFANTNEDEVDIDNYNNFINEYNLNIKLPKTKSISNLYQKIIDEDLVKIELDNLINSFIDEDDFIKFFKDILLWVMDELWIEHMQKLEEIKTEISFIWQMQRDPLTEYKWRSYKVFEVFIENINFRFVNVFNDFLLKNKEGIKKVDTI